MRELGNKSDPLPKSCPSSGERILTHVGEPVEPPDVQQFPGHIACSAASIVEIVVPLFDASGEVWAVLDIDSVHRNDFSDVDGVALEQVAAWLKGHR